MSADTSVHDATLSTLRCLKVIGKGSSGRAFLASIDGSPIVVKQTSLKNLAEKKRVRRAHLEVSLLSAVSHPFIIHFNSAFRTSANLYLILEYCAGGELYRVLAAQRGRCLPGPHPPLSVPHPPPSPSAAPHLSNRAVREVLLR
jgi:serine/threonine protein kinase